MVLPFLLKISSPSNLVLDSEASSAAEWSFSMATPIVSRQTVKETPSLSTCASVATSTEGGETALDCPTTDESVLQLRCITRYPPYKKQTSSRRRRLGGIKSEKVRRPN